MSSKDINESLKISPTPSNISERDGSNDARKINNGKMMGESDDENMSGFESDSDDENNQHGNGEKMWKSNGVQLFTTIFIELDALKSSSCWVFQLFDTFWNC
jgi:hypothetical protein